jgi:hypothetical protein
MATLHLLTGPWASGKTSVVPHLARLLPEVVVFDWDILLPGLSAAAGKDASRDASTWEGLEEMWVAVVESVLAGGRDVLLCGPVVPEDLAGTPLNAFPLRCAYLDCEDEVLVGRLRARGTAEEEIPDELETMAALRRSGHARVVAGDRTPPRIAAEVAAWIHATRA